MSRSQLLLIVNFKYKGEKKKQQINMISSRWVIFVKFYENAFNGLVWKSPNLGGRIYTFFLMFFPYVFPIMVKIRPNFFTKWFWRIVFSVKELFSHLEVGLLANDFFWS